VAEPARTDKMSVTVPSEIAAEIRARAGHGNVSSYVTHALMRQLEHDRLGDLVTELERTQSPATADELAAARSEWRR
jgi:hypothetical protein